MKKMQRINSSIPVIALITGLLVGMVNVSAAVVGYGVDISYDTATTSNVGTFPITNIKAVFNSATKPSTAGDNSATTKTTSFGSDKSSGTAVYTYSDQSTGTVSVAATTTANRTNDGTYGLKYDFTQAKNAEGIALATKAKATDGTRDLYFSVWIKSLKADGTLAEYSTNSISTSTFTERSNAPFGVYLTYTNEGGSAAGAMFLSEANAVEETTADGWRKISAIIPAAYANSIKFTMYAINYTDNENSHGYGTADRSYLLVDDIYLAEIPTSIAWADTDSYSATTSSVDISALGAITAYDANNEQSNIADGEISYSISGAAEINGDKIAYTDFDAGTVTVTAKYLSDSVTAEKTISFPETAADNKYGTDISYDTVATENGGTFPVSNIKMVFNGTSQPTTVGTSSPDTKTASYEDEGNTSGSAVYTYSDQGTGTVSVAADLEANRTNDGTYGLKYDFTQANNAEGIALTTKAKATDGTRDLYFSVWIKPLKADGTLAEYSTNSIDTSTFTERSNAPFGVYLTYTDTDDKAAGAMFLSEANAVEETTADGWRKISAIIPAAYANSIKFTMYAINYTDNENSNGYGTADRSYLLVDDIYLAEIPTSIAWTDTEIYNVGDSVMPLSDLGVIAFDANGAGAFIAENDNVLYTITGDAYIYEDNLLYTGLTNGNITIKAELLSKSTTVKTFNFNAYVPGDLVIDIQPSEKEQGAYTVNVQNNTTNSQNVVVLTAVYDDEGNLHDIIVTEPQSPVSSRSAVSFDTEIPDTNGVTLPKIKAFVWDSTSTLTPLSEVFLLN